MSCRLNALFSEDLAIHHFLQEKLTASKTSILKVFCIIGIIEVQTMYSYMLHFFAVAGQTSHVQNCSAPVVLPGRQQQTHQVQSSAKQDVVVKEYPCCLKFPLLNNCLYFLSNIKSRCSRVEEGKQSNPCSLMKNKNLLHENIAETNKVIAPQSCELLRHLTA